MEEQKTAAFQLPKLSILKWVVLTICACLAQAIHYPIFGDISFSFGSVFLLIILRRFGFLPTLLSLGLTFPIIWGQDDLFYQGFVILEFAALSELLKRYPKENIVFLDAVYWLFLGTPIYLFIHKLFLEIPFQAQSLDLLSLVVNALFSALISGLLIQIPSIRKLLGFQQNQNRFYLKQAIFNLLILFLMVPVLTVTLYNAHKQEEVGILQVHQDLDAQSHKIEEDILSWLGNQKMFLKQLNMDISEEHLMKESALINVVEQKLSLDRYIEQALIVDTKMNVRAAYKLDEENLLFEDLSLMYKANKEPVFRLYNNGVKRALIFKEPIKEEDTTIGYMFAAYDLNLITEVLSSAVGDSLILRMMDDNSGEMLVEMGIKLSDDFREGSLFEQENDLFLWQAPIRFNQAIEQDLYYKDFKFKGLEFLTFSLAVPVHDYRVKIEQSYITHLTILLIFVVIALIFAYVASSRVVIPLEKLSQMSSHLPDRIRNRQPVYWPETSLVEVASLLNSYKKMSEAMHSNVSKLEDTKRQLEERVVEEEQARQSTEKQAEQMLNQMMDAVLVVLHTGNVFFANQKAEEFLEVDKEALDSLKFDQLFADSDHQKLRYEVAQRLKRITDKGVNLKTFIHQKHHHRPVDVSINPIEIADETAVFLSFRDMSLHNEMEESLAKTQGRFHQILQALGDPILILNKDCKVIDANPAAAIAFDMELSKFKESLLTEFVQDNRLTEFSEIFENLLGSKEKFMSFEMTFLSSDKKYLSFDVSVNAVEVEGLDDCFILVCRDLSTYKYVQKELYRARNSLQEALEAKTHFLGNMSHELRTPMNTIVNMVDEVNRKVDDKELAGYTERLDRASDSLLELVNDMFEHAQMDMQNLELAKEPVNVEELVRQVSVAYTFHAEDKGMTVETAIDANVPETVITDGTRLKQIILKLTSTLIRTVETGDLHIHALVKEADQQQALISIEFYNGSGLVDASYVELIQKILLNPTQALSEKHKNIGLGLVVVAQLAEQMGLSLVAKTYRDGIKLELEGYFKVISKTSSKSEAMSADDIQKELIEREEPAKILVVDDSSDNRFILQMLLKPLAVDVVEVTNGEEAVDAFKAQDFDVVLMDMLMPVMDGYEATGKIKKIQQEEEAFVPIVALTANALKEDEEKCREAGCDAYLSKPIKKEALYEQLHNALTN